jgi:hypothetical protein
MPRLPAVPPGFRRLFRRGRPMYQAIDRYVVLEHDSLIASILAERGMERCTMPDQMQCMLPHLPHRFAYKLDLAHAFDSIHPFGLGLALGLDEDFERTWRTYFHEQGGLIQGAPASPILFHLYMEEFVEPGLALLCEELALTWTRFVDDFLFSAHSFIDRATQKRIRAFFRSMALRVHERKTHAYDTHREPLTHLGIVLYRGKVDVTNEVKAALVAAKLGTPRSRQIARWRERVLALNAR